MRIPNRKLKIMDTREASLYALLAQGNHGLNLMGVVSQPFRVGSAT
jgi:hypothetical protein